MSSKRKKFISLLSLILIIFGLAGSIISFSLIPFVASYDIGAEGVQGIKEPVAQEFVLMAKTLDHASNTTANAGVSIRNAKNSLSSGSVAASFAGTGFSAVAGFVDFSVLGFKPFGGAGQYFTEGGQKLNVLSNDLESTSKSLEQNAKDMELLSADFKIMSNKMVDISKKIDKSTISLKFGNIKLISIFFLAYLGMLQLAIAGIGVAIHFLNRHQSEHKG